MKRKKSLKEQGRKRVGVNDIKIEMSDDEDESSLDSQVKKTLLANNSSSAIDRKLKVSAMNELEKYKEIQKRTKLLYGVKDVKRMIEKSDASKHFYQKDITYIKALKAE